MLDVWTPALLREAAPEARLLVLLRDPVERFRSGRTLAENRFTVGSTARAAANAAFNRGIYADQLMRLWTAFPREQVLVLQYERCVADTRTQLERTYAFMGLAPEIPAGLDPGGRVNESRGPKVVLSEWQEDQLVRRYAPRTSGWRSCCRSLTCRCGSRRDDAQVTRAAPGGARLACLVPLAWATSARTARPARCPDGWKVGPPHYVGVGAQKAGTSWWNRLIEAHPDVVNAGRQRQGAALLRPRLGDSLRR